MTATCILAQPNASTAFSIPPILRAYSGATAPSRKSRRYNNHIVLMIYDRDCGEAYSSNHYN